jgi:tetratricopeptide (TPR) repeat protein/tRNA A-37 threonylcarbamoyl transferase component Bud32
MLCPNCATPLPPASSRCPACGTLSDSDLTREGASGARLPQERPGSTLVPGQTFTSRYTILKLLGAGGMGEVYQAWDEVLGTPVALKIIPPQAAADPFDAAQLEQRFRRELRLARQVTHPNVVRIHDLGELAEIRYLTMQFVSGSDLGSLLRQGRLPLARALGIAKQIAAGLAAVHDAGVVHRDLKPANVMVDADDRALLTDFGIARAVDAATIQTLPGSVLGTLEYMAPEQARGETADVRSDIYAFGLILYEMLAGGRPASPSDGALASLIQRIEKGPPPLRDVAPGVPADLAHIVQRCLAADPANRYPSVKALLADLDRLAPDGRATLVAHRKIGAGLWRAAAAALAAGLVVAAGAWLMLGRHAAPPPVQHEPISVLIADMRNAAEDPVFDGSLEQALGVAMEAAPFVTTYPRRDAVRLAQSLRSGATLDEASARLVAVREGIRVVLAGTIARAGDGYSMSVKAVSGAAGDELARASASASNKADVLRAIGTVAEDLRRELGDTPVPEQLKAETFSASSLEAVKDYATAQAQSLDRRNEEAIAHYRKALEADPSFARAYAGLAAAAYDLGRREEGRVNWEKALSLIDQMTAREKYRTLGTYYLAIAHNNDKAIESYTELVNRYPADLAGHNNLAVAYFNKLDFPHAFEEGRRAIQLYPKSLKFRGNYALYAMYAGDFKTAAENAAAIVRENPGYIPAYLPLAMDALARGDVASARSTYAHAGSIDAEGASLAAIGLADIALLEKRYADAEAMLTSAIATDLGSRNTAGAAAKTVALAEAYEGLGRVPDLLKTVNSALALSRDDAVLVPCARLLLRAGRDDEAGVLIKELSDRPQSQSSVYAAMLQAERALRHREPTQAIEHVAESKKLPDLWLVRLTRGIAYQSAGHNAEALQDFEVCRRRIGETTALFLDDVPTFRYTAVLNEWLSRTTAALSGQRSGDGK